MTGADQPVIASFVAPGHLSGRTSVAANLAWMLASSGQDVLVVDWDFRGTSIHDYLRPFLVDEVTGTGIGAVLGGELAAALSRAADLGSLATGPLDVGPVLRRYVPAAGRPGTRLDVLEHRLTPARDAYTTEAVIAFTELRARLLASQYDYVLVDGPPSGTGPAALLEGRLADRVVLCFPSRAADAGAAARLAVEIVSESPAQARIIAVPTFLDHTDPGHASEQTADLRRILLRALDKAPVPAGDTLRQVVPIPFHTMLDVLVPLVFDRDEQREPLLIAYEQLLKAITDDRVPALPAHTRSLTGRYRDLIRSRSGASSPESRRVDLVYCAADRPWVDWIADQLTGAGAQVGTLCLDLEPGPPPSGAVIVAGSGLTLERAGLDGGQGPDLLVLRVAPDAEEVAGTHGVVLYDCAPAQARWRLLAALAMSGEPLPGEPARLPSTGPGPVAGFNVPACDRATAHRAREFEALRDALRAAEHGSRALITGGSGTGKTHLAKEYAHRYAHEYRVAWFVPARTRQTARRSLVELAGRIGAVAGDEEDLPAAALHRAADDYRPYLIIYDDVTDVGALAGLVPDDGSGHVIYTRTPETPDESPDPRTGTLVRLPSLDRDEARRTLRGQLRDVAEEHLDTLLDAVGTDPLTIRLTAGCLRAASRVLRAGDAMHAGEASAVVVQQFLRALPQRSADRLADVARCLLELLTTYPDGHAVAALALMCANLSPDGVALRLVRSSAFLSGLVTATGRDDMSTARDDMATGRDDEDTLPLANDAAEIEVLLANAAAFELFGVDWGGRRELRMHRMIQKALREVTDPARMRSIRWTTMLALSAYAPNDAEYLAGDGAAALEILAPHVEPVGALGERQLTAVRRWVVVHVGSIARTGTVEERQEALGLVDRVRDAWGERAADPLGVRLAMHHADLLRSLGRNTEALRIDMAMRDLPQSSPAGGQLRAALNRRGTPGDLRGVGAFGRALTEDKRIYRALRTMLGPDHPQTLQARHNLAVSNYLDGRQVDAARREEETYHARLRLDENDILTWWCAIDLAIFRRELGELTDSRLLLTLAADRLRGIVGVDDHPQIYRAMAARAVTERRSGDPHSARTYSSKASVGYRKTLGDQSLVTQGAQLSMAIDYSLTGDMTYALEVAGGNLAEFRRQLEPGHPFIAICLTNVAGIQRRAGKAAEAVRSAEEAVTIFTRLSRSHPWTVAARTNQANALAAAGETDEAVTVHADAVQTAGRFLPIRHPYLAVLAGNAGFVRGPAAGSAAPDSAGNGPVDIDIEVPST
ncbi:FxSxx-COOH system tetratricopeptide repeat protein [Actinoplanes sp. NPDC023936]|uniref:FxSxx-COOH system tetratricopeptide repeat protein n=1 Tax=Actinoplanes sp. NPDC023936 TaxID=3154910 RepID=UPI0033CA6CE6